MNLAHNMRPVVGCTPRGACNRSIKSQGQGHLLDIFQHCRLRFSFLLGVFSVGVLLPHVGSACNPNFTKIIFEDDLIISKMICLVAHETAIADTIAAIGPYSAIASRGQLEL